MRRADPLQMIARDLWAYQLAISPLPPLPDVIPSATAISQSLPVTALVADDRDHEPRNLDEKSDNEGTSRGSTPSLDDDKSDIDPELFAELSEYSSEKEEQLCEISLDASPRSDSRWRRKRTLRASDTIVTLTVALWVLRVPVLNVEIER